MLQHEYFHAKTGFGTTENEPSKFILIYSYIFTSPWFQNRNVIICNHYDMSSIIINVIILYYINYDLLCAWLQPHIYRWPCMSAVLRRDPGKGRSKWSTCFEEQNQKLTRRKLSVVANLSREIPGHFWTSRKGSMGRQKNVTEKQRRW